ncbi:MAG: hypothetical protein AAGC77_05880 [Pseudomonadota bacterium]
MSTVATLALTVAATIGAVGLVRYAKKRARGMRDFIDEARRSSKGDAQTIEYEKDPESGIFKPKS